MRSGKHRGQKKQKRKGAYDKSGGITHDTAAYAFRTKDILKIRSRPRLEPGSDYHYLVQKMGVEPTRYCYHTDLNRARLPIPPLLRLAAFTSNENYYIVGSPICQLYFTKFSLSLPDKGAHR